jgi:UDP-glucose 4-epimerase
MTTVLVTGGAGFMGAHVSRELLDAGYDVVVVDDLSGGFERNVDPRAKFVCADVCNYKHMSEIFEEHKFEFVFHLAAYAAEGLSHFIKRFNYNNNLIGSVNLINEAVKHKIKCFVFTSSIAVYGTNQTPMHEGLIPQPEDPYGIAKYAVEMDLEVTREMFGLPYIVFRPHNVYGKFQNIGDKYRNVIGIFMNQLMQELPVTVFGDGEQTRAFSYISDVAQVISKSISEPKAYNQVFNIGGDRVYTVNYLVEAVARAMGCEAKMKYLDARHEVKHAFSDHSKVTKLFNVKGYVPLNEGLQRMADWAKKIGPCQGKPFENIEIEENMPPSWRMK